MPRGSGRGLDCDPTMMIRFRPLLALATSLALVASPSFAQEPQAKTLPNQTAQPLKELRYAFRIAETGFDPASITDLYSRTVAGAIFDAPLEFEFLARPARVRPNTAAAMPEVSEDFRTFTFRIRPGIYFDDDPAFKGRRRELTAADYVYSIKRHYDPRWKSGNRPITGAWLEYACASSKVGGYCSARFMPRKCVHRHGTLPRLNQ